MFFRKRKKKEEINDINTNQATTADFSPRQSYAIILDFFFQNIEQLISYSDRLETMMDLSSFDEEYAALLEITKNHTSFTMETYNSSKETYKDELVGLDSQCLNIDYIINKSMDMEINGLNKMIEGFENKDQTLSQSGLDESSAALATLNPVIKDMGEVIKEIKFG